MKNVSVVSLIAVAAGVLFVSMPAGAQTCIPVTDRQIAALFDRWNASLATGDPDKVIANYASDGVLLPTVSNQPRTNLVEIRDYFVKFLKSKPQGTIDQRIIKIGCNIAQDVGTYTFNTHKIQHHYCSTCGIAPYSEGQNPDGSAAACINVRCLDDVDLATLKVISYDGRSK